MKKASFLFIILICVLGFSQNKEILILDKTTNLPVENALILYPNLNDGTFTNSEGLASIVIINSDLLVKKLGYEDVTIRSEAIANSNIIYLTQKAIQLNEVVVRSFNLKKALYYVLNNYDSLYVNTPFEKECNFKETLIVDDKLKRLILSDVNWWGKSYQLKKNFNELKLRLGSIDYSKNIPMGIVNDSTSEGVSLDTGFIETKSMVSAIYLNVFIATSLLFTDDYNYTANIEDSTKDELLVSYQTEWKKEKGIDRRSVGKIVFDKTSKAIIAIENEVQFRGNIKHKIAIGYKGFSFITKNTNTEHSFYKNADQKWSLRSFVASADVTILYKSISHPAIFQNSIFVLKETPLKKVTNEGLIDLEMPIYKSLPSNTIANSNGILLNKEEKDFIESN